MISGRHGTIETFEREEGISSRCGRHPRPSTASRRSVCRLFFCAELEMQREASDHIMDRIISAEPAGRADVIEGEGGTVVLIFPEQRDMFCHELANAGQPVFSLNLCARKVQWSAK